MNYGDNIYFINETLKLLTNSMKLELDAALTAEHLKQQLQFADKLLTSLYEKSAEIQGLSHYDDTLRSIQKSKYRFCSYLESLSGDEEAGTARIRLDGETLESIQEKHEADIREIEHHFSNEDNLKTPEDLVSQEEFRYLFGTDEAE